MRRVLLADDSPFILETLASRLRDNGIHVVTATNGKEAVDEGARVDPDLAILDVSMPVMNGLEAAKRLHEIIPDLPIILFTAYADVLKSAIHQPGVIAVFDKGSRLVDLISAVDQCLRTNENLAG